jgi:hypothetical protein
MEKFISMLPCSPATRSVMSSTVKFSEYAGDNLNADTCMRRAVCTTGTE